jgi:uncharacterized membrane-anchored protein
MSETSLDRPSNRLRLGPLVDWFKLRERPLLLLGAAAQIVVLVGMIGLHALPLLRGKTVLLRVQPVDPRDMFRGDYVTLSYEFSRLPAHAIAGLPDEHAGKSARLQGRTVYVQLVPEADGVHYRGGAYSLTPPGEGLFLKGTPHGWNQIDFGIDRYFVQEGTGHKYEEAVRSRRLWAQVAVAPDGQAVVTALKIE